VNSENETHPRKSLTTQKNVLKKNESLNLNNLLGKAKVNFLEYKVAKVFSAI